MAGTTETKSYRSTGSVSKNGNNTQKEYLCMSHRESQYSEGGTVLLNGLNGLTGNLTEINPIENVWAILNEAVFTKPKSTNRQSLIERVRSQWDQIGKGHIFRLF